MTETITMTTPPAGPVSVPMPAGRVFALAWLAVALAASDDKERPALYRRVHVREFDHGVELAATDGYWFARAWCPFDDDDPAAWRDAPTLDEVAVRQFTVADVEHRIRGLMRYVAARTARTDDATGENVEVDVAVTLTNDYDPDTPTLDPTLSAPQVLVEIPGEERIVARLSEVEFPNLARLARIVPEAVDHLVFGPKLMQRVAQAVQRIGAPGLCVATTSTGAVEWSADWLEFTADGCLSGLLMPMRRPEVSS